MAKHFVLDESAGRAHKTVFPDAKQAIEKAAESARNYNRAISVWEYDNERDHEPGTTPDAKQLHCIVYPDGKTKKAKKGVNPYVEYFENKDAKEPGPNGGAERQESLEEFLKLPGNVLGKVISQLDEAIIKLGDKNPATRTRLHAIADKFVSEQERRVNINKQLVRSFKLGDVFATPAGSLFTVEEVDASVGTVNQMAASEWAKILLKASAQRLTAAEGDEPAEEPSDKPAEEPVKEEEAPQEGSIKPGTLAVVDDHDDAYVLDAADKVFVVLMNDSVTTVPDDASRIRAVNIKNDQAAQKKQRIFSIFFKQLLHMVGADGMSGLDEEQKARFFDMARAKWPKLKAKMLDSQPEEKNAPAPKKEEPTEEPEAPASDKLQKNPADKSAQPEASTLLSFLMDCCSKDLEAAARLTANLTMAARDRDPTKMAALRQMTTFSGYKLPTGWFSRATALARAKRTVAQSVSLVPPSQLSAVARVALAEHADDLPQLTRRVAKTLAAGRALDMDTVEAMVLFFRNFSQADVVDPVWAGFGGRLGQAYAQHIAGQVGL